MIRHHRLFIVGESLLGSSEKRCDEAKLTIETTATNEIIKIELTDDALRMSLFKLSGIRKPPIR